MSVRNLVRPVLVVLATVGPGLPAAAQILPPLPPPPVQLPVLPTPQLQKLDVLMLARYSNGLGPSRAIVQASDAAAMSRLADLIRGAGGTVGRQLTMLDAVAANLSRDAVAVLSQSPFVRRIVMDRPIVGMSERTNATIGATSVRQDFGYDGAGIGVAVIDSGVAASHDDLGTPGPHRVVRFVDFISGSAAPYDDYGHGTHVAGLIAGSGFDSNGARAGVAPAAHLVVLKVLDGSGRGRISDVIAAIEYAIQQRSQLQIRVINLSIGAGVFESHQTDLLTLAAKRAVESGIVVVASAGNAGKDRSGRPLYGGITAPGNAPWVLTVGASSHAGTIERSDDTIASFSSRGPTAIDRSAKPDLVAPGVGIESLSAPQSYLFQSRPQYLLNGTIDPGYAPYFSLSGTSQSAPVVSGTVALMLQANPALTPNAIKAILQYTAESRPEYDAMTQGAGFVNARGAIDLVRYLVAPSSAPYPTPPEWSAHVVWGNRRLHDGRVAVDANAWSSDVTWGDARTPDSSNVQWGTVCTGPACDAPEAWTPWRTSCVDPACLLIQWGDGQSENVVWGTTCGGQNCPFITPYVPPAAGATGAGEGDTVVWGTTDNGDTVVWGTTDSGDTVVWGTTDNGDTVVWGTSGDQGVIWEENCEEPDPRPSSLEEAGHVQP